MRGLRLRLCCELKAIPVNGKLKQTRRGCLEWGESSSRSRSSAIGGRGRVCPSLSLGARSLWSASCASTSRCLSTRCVP